MIAAIRILAYEVSANFMDEYSRIGETTAIKSFKKIVKAIVSKFSEEYLRSPNNNDIARLLAVGQHRGFLRMLGALTVWSHNDINVLERSSVVSKLAEGRAPPVNYLINGNDHSMGYYLADARKDVERAFGVLQARFAIVRGPTRFFHLQTLKDIMMTCIILHNMIVEDERHTYLGANDFDYDQIDDNGPEPVSHNPTCNLMQFIEHHNSIRDRGIHSQLQADLVEHLWQLQSQS
ncbi:hypothetical protein SO802_033347 [Lithocarpus litseifolius]|uniref:DDE Tnp4 domain-containing protein n=1 Tax=Lithocarpus litseifolius TaxID=425828 RepID=A0AAW2BES2_9ROSI